MRLAAPRAQRRAVHDTDVRPIRGQTQAFQLVESPLAGLRPQQELCALPGPERALEGFDGGDRVVPFRIPR
jgi:hypothetical protein